MLHGRSRTALCVIGNSVTSISGGPGSMRRSRSSPVSTNMLARNGPWVAQLALHGSPASTVKHRKNVGSGQVQEDFFDFTDDMRRRISSRPYSLSVR